MEASPGGLWGTDDDMQSPFEVVVDQEGIFGFHVVVVSRNGMAGRKPRSGDLADIWIGVDTTIPDAHLTAAVYGEGANAGKLFIRWEATDLHLDDRPITLKFAENADGPWTVIASALPNSGEYVWPADPQLPASVYLRLEARDEAGNVTADSLKEPVTSTDWHPKLVFAACSRCRTSTAKHFVSRVAVNPRHDSGCWHVPLGTLAGPCSS